MFTNKMRPAFLTAIVFIAIATLMITVSPTVRAAISSIFTFNGVEVGQDDETGEIVVDGNLDAIIYQDEDMVIIDGGDEDDVVVEPDAMVPESDLFHVDELSTLYPDFVLPTNLPDGYELVPTAFKIAMFGVETDSIGVEWSHENGEAIVHFWSDDVGVSSSSLILGFDKSEYGGFLSRISDDGIYQSISTSDGSFTEEQLRAMLP